MKKEIFFTIFIISIINVNTLLSVEKNPYIKTEYKKGYFPLVTRKHATPILISQNDYKSILKAARDLSLDIEKVTDKKPKIIYNVAKKAKTLIIIGSLEKSNIIKSLIKSKKIDTSDIKDRWETYKICIVKKPFKGIKDALVIVGSDKRGTIFGIYDISLNIGVSPWYWWADVPIQHKDELYIPSDFVRVDSPKVQYRGLFINDEAPALSGWAYEKFGGFNHKFYTKVFELILRLKGNFLWPAMWGRSFFEEDTLNFKLANEYGIVISTSHHEPLMRAHVEWRWHGEGPWNYEKNAEVLKEFWKEGVERSKNYECIYTIGMRGDGDEPMTEGTAIKLLERIVTDQRNIIREVTGKDPSEVPQVWALYKEVQDYYDKGMKVPDDVTLLFSDDNWGNIRRLPPPGSKPRKGGYGMYYHFDYYGGPRSYKWLNTIQIERVWEQMHLTYVYGVRKIWIVNIGDIKPMEFPIEFFLDFAWDPTRWNAEDLPQYYKLWAKEQFPDEFADDIANILAKYTKYNARRKPELLSPETYSLFNYNEFERVVNEYNEVAKKAEEINARLPEKYRDAYYQLIIYPTLACANLNELYYTVAKNRLYAKQTRALTNYLAKKVKKLFEKDSLLSYKYNKEIANRKWNHMMDQTHIGYTSWRDPERNIMPEVYMIENKNEPDIAIMVEGSSILLPDSGNTANLPEFDNLNNQTYYIEIFNRGKEPFTYEIGYDKNILTVSEPTGEITTEKRVYLSINWNNVPAGKNTYKIKIRGNDKSFTINVPVFNYSGILPENFVGYVESNGYISIEAPHYTSKVEKDTIRWVVIPNLGRTNFSITPMPVTVFNLNPEENSPRLEFNCFFRDSGKVAVYVYVSPTQNFFNTPEGLRFAMSFDNERPQVVSMHKNDIGQDWTYPMWWNESVANNIRIYKTEHYLDRPGVHTLKLIMVDSGIVFQKIVIDTGGLKKSYLGPPESYRVWQ
ncbi:MAG: glycosyl hydrolase 115 family protein [Candidatus Marinimicrobia bacterium]|nr:glycosyl hydrolase 115 family protein [Candidatus Neomarinimicrobiota bacterium]